IIGPSGSGKSTLLRCVNCLNRITSGTITLNGETFVDTSESGKAEYIPDKELRRICAETGMVFQHFNLFPHMTCLQNICYAPIKVKKEDRNSSHELLQISPVCGSHFSGFQGDRSHENQSGQVAVQSMHALGHSRMHGRGKLVALIF
ncbi:ATP-binding cassette domain-containing protein, partial [Intestinibacillus massiliensis]|nr:ATP-binding cassette domain-containing protein [Intestinibacillus massiliensis]